jgi:hypothetical protein
MLVRRHPAFVQRPSPEEQMVNNEKLADLLEHLARELRENNKPLPDDIQRGIHDNLWRLYGEPPVGRPMCDACSKGGVCGCYQPQWDSPTCKA